MSSPRANGHMPDPRAVQLAQTLLERVPADNVVIFGSRARGDWHAHSDIDLLIVQASKPQHLDIDVKAHELASRIYGRPIDIDCVFRTHRECRIQIQHSVNGIAAVAQREGVSMEPYPQPWNGPEPEPEPDLTEYGEMDQRLTDANENYLFLQLALDHGMELPGTAAHAQGVLEHALKALISAYKEPYPRTHKLNVLCRTAHLYATALKSNLDQLDQYAGAEAYVPPTYPVSDFATMGNNVTEDVSLIYEKIKEMIGLDAWTIQPSGAPNPIQSVYQ